MAGHVIDKGDTGSHEPGASNREGVKVAFGAGRALQSTRSQKVIIMGCITHVSELGQTLHQSHSFPVFGVAYHVVMITVTHTDHVSLLGQ